MLDKDVLSEFGRNVRTQREKQSLTQEELAEKAFVHRTYIGAVERGERNVSLRNIVAIARALDARPADLMPEK